MARKILCICCDAYIKDLADRHNECFESKKGLAKLDLNCDSCGVGIPKYSDCTAGVLLPYVGHKNYESQKPEAWMELYLF